MANHELYFYDANGIFSSGIDIGNATSTDEAQGWGFFSIPVPLGPSGGLCIVDSGAAGYIEESTSYGQIGPGANAIGGRCDGQRFVSAGNWAGANEDGSMSMQKVGEGDKKQDFSWTVSASTEGLINDNQCFFPEGAMECAQTICRAAPTTR